MPSAVTRVLHVHSGNMYGGVEAVLETLHRERSRAPGLAHEFALCFDGRLRQSLGEAGAVAHDLGAARVSRPDQVLRARRRLTRVLRAAAPDVVVTHSSWSHALFAPVARRARRPVVTWVHDRPDGRHWLQRLAARHRPDLVLANSAFTAGASDRVYPGVPVSIVRCPVSLKGPAAPSVRDGVRRELGVDTNTRVVIQVSRLEPYKGHQVLLDALGRLARRDDWACWIAGGAQRPAERAYAAALTSQALASGLAGRVRFLGMRDDVDRLLAGADVFCQPNVGPEPFGIAFVQALDAGLPVVTTAIGGATEIVSEGCGMLVPPHDAGTLAETLATLFDDGDRRGEARRLGPLRARELCDPAARLRDLEDALERLGR